MAQYLVVSGDTAVKRSGGKLKGFLCTAAASTPAVTIYDNTAASGTKIVDALTPVAGTMYSFPADGIYFNNGLYVDITNTVTLTMIYE